MEKALAILIAGTIALAVLLWLAVTIRPAAFPPYPEPSGPIGTVPLPKGLPTPVERYFRSLYGDQVPVIESAVLSGRASMRPAGPIYLPARFRFTYIAGQAYRHYIEVTLFGIPLLVANEHFVDNKGRMEITLFGTDDGEKYDQAANLGLWAEFRAIPSVYITDPRVRWEAIDDESAILVVPYKDTVQRFVVRFDPATAMMTWTEAMRFKTSASESKVLWLTGAADWTSVGDRLVSRKGTVTWADDGKPWFIMETEELIVNVDVSRYIRAKGL